MKKWKKVALALTAVMMFTTVAGIAGCKKKPQGEGPGGGDPTVTLREDTRADAYVAYKPDGTELGKYKSLAAAINAAVENDADEEQVGSYVRKAGGKHNLFTNRAGYEGTGTGNDDTFWFYDGGTKLEQVDCWQTNHVAGELQNSDYVVAKISHFGTDAVQSWNGYRVLNADGEAMDTDEKFAQSWELSSTMDVGMMSFPKRLNGVTRQTYELDLSDVKITPPYKGADSTYAFMGFYNWQDFYVIDIGIACDTATGVWYPFIATSRDDSFSDAEYKFDDTVIMKSTWNAEGGYFKPNLTGLTMQIETELLEDGGDTYQSNLFTVVNSATNEKLYEFRVEAETTQEYFSTNIGMENTYVFNAGLDIKSELGFDDTHVKLVDYFNGAAFENLKITTAEWYFPTEEEISNGDYGRDIDDDLRGKTFDLVLAKADKNIPNGVYDYVLLNNSYFADYSAVNGADVYSFSFNKPATSDEEYGTTLGGYQNAIDELIGVTEETVINFADKIEEMNKWDSVSVPQKYYQLLDFAPLTAASELLTAVMNISDAAKAVKADFNALENIDSYAYKGWEAPDTAIKGYLWSEIQKFNSIKAAYEALDTEDKDHLKFHIDMKKYAKWTKLSTEMTAAYDAIKASTTTVVYGVGKKQPDAFTATPLKDVFEEFVYFVNGVKMFDKWDTNITFDVAAKNDGTDRPVIYKMDIDANWYAGVKICYAYEYIKACLDEANVDVPKWIEDLLDAIDYNGYYEGYSALYGTTLAALKIKNNLWQNDKDLERFLNKVWGPDYSIPALVSWNWTDNQLNNWATAPRTQYLYKLVFAANPDLNKAALLDNGVPTTPQIWKVVGDWITERFGFEIKGTKWGITQGKFDLSVNVSPEAEAVINQINALSTLNASYRVIEWVAPEGAASIKGYYYSEILAVRAAKTAYDALIASDKSAVTATIDEANWNAWLAESTAFAAIEAKGDALTALNFKIDNKRALTIAGTATGEDPVKYDAIEIFTGEELVAAGSTAPQAVAHPTDTFYETVYVKSFPAQTSMENGVYAMRQMLMHASFISTTVTGMKDTSAAITNSMIANNGNQNRNVRISLCYDYLVKELEVELTPYMKAVLGAVNFDDWYVFYEPVAALIPVAARINALGADATVANLDEADLALLNKYYTNRFTPNTFMTGVITTLDSGYKWRAPVFVKALETVLLGKESPDANPAGDFNTYFANGINAFLVKNGYTIAQNGWGVTVGSISAAEVDAEVMATAALIAGISKIDDNYTMIGWEAPTGTPIAGYTYSEYLSFNAYKIAYAALSDEKKAQVDELTNAAEKIASWEAFAPEIEKLITNPAWDTFTFSNALLANMGVTGRNWGDDGPGTFTENQQNGLALVYILKWTKSISTSTNAWGDWSHANVINNPTDSVYAPFADMYWIYRQLDQAGIAKDLPAMVKSAYNAVLTHYTNGVNYTKELDFLFGATEIILKKEAGTATKAEVVNLVNTYMVNKTKWLEGGLEWNYVAAGTYSWGSVASDCMGRVDAVLQRYYGLPTTTTIGVQVKAILDMIPDVPTVAYGKGSNNGNPYSPIGVSRQITEADVTGFTQAPGYSTTQSGTLLPQFNTGWAVEEVEADADITTVASDSEGYKFTLSRATTNAVYVKAAQTGKNFSIKGKALYYNFGGAEKYDVLVYFKVDGGDQQTVYLSDFFANDKTYNTHRGDACLTGNKEGMIALADLAAFKDQSGTNIEITEIRARLFSGDTFKISAFYVDSLPGYADGHDGSLLPEFAADWTLPADNSGSVEVASDGYVLKTTATGGKQFTYDFADIENVSIANNTVYFDVTAEAGTSYTLYVFVQAASGEGYFPLNGSEATFSGKGYLTLKDALDYLVARTTGTTQGSQKSEWGFAATDTTLTITKIRIDVYGAAGNLKISELYVDGNPGYTATQDRNLLPSLMSDWTANKTSATLTADSEGYKFSATEDTQFVYEFETPVEVSVNDSLFFEAAASGNYTIYVFFRSAEGTEDGYAGIGTANGLPNTAGNGNVTLKTVLAHLVSRTNNGKTNWKFTGNEETLKITKLRIDAYTGVPLTLSALYLDTTPILGYEDNHAGTLLPTLTSAWTKTELDGVTASEVVAEANDYKFSSTDGDTQFAYNVPGELKIDATKAIYYQDTFTGSNTIYVFFNDGSTPAKQGYVSVKALDPDGKGYVTYAQVLAQLVSKASSKGWTYTGNEEELTVAYVRLDIYNGPAVTLSALYLAEAPAEALYGNAGTSALAGVTAGSFKTAYNKPSEDRTYDLNQETAEIEVTNGVVTVLETGANIYSYSLQTDIKIKRNTVLYYDLEGDGDGVDLVIWLSKANHYFNLAEVINWKATGEKKVANNLIGVKKGYVTGGDIIDYLIARPRDGWGFTADANITEIGIYEIVTYLNNATLTINDLRVIGEYSTTQAVSYSKDNPTVFTDWYTSPAKLEKGTSITISGSQTREKVTPAEGDPTNKDGWLSALLQLNETSDGTAVNGNGATLRTDRYFWFFGTSTLTTNAVKDTGREGMFYFGDSASCKSPAGVAEDDAFAMLPEIANDCDFTMTATWNGDTITVTFSVVAKTAAIAGYTFECGYVFGAANTTNAIILGVTAEATSNLSVTSVTTTYLANN